MSLTNAQAALQAAATCYQGRMNSNVAEDVLRLAGKYKTWLDTQLAATATPSPQQLPGPRPPYPPLQRPPASAARPNRGLHHLRDDPNGDPICNCGWRPTWQWDDKPTREEARTRIREHIAWTKENPSG